jgi:GNAT superfamily N-acetyltransferase
MNNDINIRKAKIDDVPIILNFIKELANYEKLAEHVYATEEILKENLFGDRAYAEVLIAEYDGSPAGYALFFHSFSTFLGKPGIYLEDLYVKQNLRGKGIGKSLLRAVIEIAQDRNCGRVEWAVLDWNKPAINFYDSLGAMPLKEWIVYRLIEEKF